MTNAARMSRARLDRVAERVAFLVDHAAQDAAPPDRPASARLARILVTLQAVAVAEDGRAYTVADAERAAAALAGLRPAAPPRADGPTAAAMVREAARLMSPQDAGELGGGILARLADDAAGVTP